jgi:hypothetical protein
MSPIVVPNTDPNLTTLDDVRTFMQKGGTTQETDQDALIATLIPQASRVIQRYTRIIAPAETGAKTFTWRGRGLLSINPWFLRSVSSLQMDTDTGSPTTLDPSSYSLQPKPSEDGVYTHIRLLGSQMVESNLELLDSSYSTTLQREVTVTGDWGYTTVPDDVRHWANVTVVEWIRKDVSAFSTGFDSNEDRLDRPEEIPFAAKRGLRQYVREATPRLPALATPRSRPAEAI